MRKGGAVRAEAEDWPQKDAKPIQKRDASRRLRDEWLTGSRTAARRDCGAAQGGSPAWNVSTLDISVLNRSGGIEDLGLRRRLVEDNQPYLRWICERPARDGAACPQTASERLHARFPEISFANRYITEKEDDSAIAACLVVRTRLSPALLTRRAACSRHSARAWRRGLRPSCLA